MRVSDILSPYCYCLGWGKIGLYGYICMLMRGRKERVILYSPPQSTTLIVQHLVKSLTAIASERCYGISSTSLRERSDYHLPQTTVSHIHVLERSLL